MTYDDGDTVVGWEKPKGGQYTLAKKPNHLHALRDMLTLVLSRAIHLAHLFLDNLVTLLADGNDLLAGHTELRDGRENLLGDGSCRLPFCKVVRVTQGIVYARRKSVQLSRILCIAYEAPGPQDSKSEPRVSILKS